MIRLVNGILTLYSWAIICTLVYFLFAIARFYQEKSGLRSYYEVYLIPIGLFAAAAVIYAWQTPAISGNFLGDLLRFLGGVILAGAGYFLYRLMVGRRT